MRTLMESDALSALSLLVAILSVLYNSWYDDIDHALGFTRTNNQSDDALILNNAKKTFRTKLIPLVLASILTTLTFIPN